MPIHYSVALTGTTGSSTTIAGAPYGIWSFEVSWSGGKLAKGSAVGIVLSSHIDIQEPSAYPDIAEIQGTQLQKSADRQWIFAPVAAGDSHVTLSFLAPSASDPFSAMQLSVARSGGAAERVPFRMGEAGSASPSQTTTAPAASGAQANGTSPAPKPAGPSGAPSGPMRFAARLIEKATLVPLNLTQQRIAEAAPGQALLKNAYARQLSLQPGEMEAVRSRMQTPARGGAPAVDQSAPLWSVLGQLASAPVPSLTPPPSAFAAIPASALTAFGNTLAEVRRDAVAQRAATAPVAGSPPPAAGTGQELMMLHIAAVANKAFQLNAATPAPLGMLNLERLEMAPAGIQRGELIGTIPLAPLEETAVTHKEWSVTDKEFTSIVTDSLENVSETGVTDNTELAQSSTSQIQHSNQFNITGTVQGGIPLISGSASSAFTDQGSESQSATDSRKHAVTITQKASSRSKQEHKVTISTKTETGTSETATRLLKNPSTTDPIRIDYFSLMRKWHVSLYRYGLRLTYDLVIPEPAGALRQAYAELADLRARIVPFAFGETHASITRDSYSGLAEKYGAQVPIYPPDLPDVYQNADPPFAPQDGVIVFDMPPLNIPAGYWIAHLYMSFHFESHTGDHDAKLQVLWSQYTQQAPQGDFGPLELTTPANGNFLLHASGPCVVSVRLENTTTVWIGLRAAIEPTPATITQWQSDTWSALYNAAQTQYISLQQSIQARIAEIDTQLSSVDTLTLRREESDEVMKNVLRFLLGPGFEFMPADVVNALKGSGSDPVHGIGFTGNTFPISSNDLALVNQYEEVVKFINQAVEWENVVTFLYSYFWDVPPGWEFVRQIRHSDAMRQAFLRAGSARVVLTIRKGWEAAWVRFADSFDTTGATNTPYLTIAREIAAYDDRNYPGIPAANPGKSAVRLEDAVYTTSKSQVGPSAAPVTLDVESSGGFVVGSNVVIDTYDISTAIQESQLVTAIPNDHQLTIERLDFAHGQDGPFPVLEPGDKGILIAEWDEYTPTAGVDIAVTSNLATIS